MFLVILNKLENSEDKESVKEIMNLKNKKGNTCLHEAVILGKYSL